MKKSFLLLILVLPVILLSGCLPKKQGEPVGEGVSTQQEGTGTESKEESYSGNLGKMMALGIPLKCSWKKDESYYGTSWVKGQKSYGEVTQEGKTAKVIFKDNCMWSWEEGNPQGFKMCFEPTDEEMNPPAGGEEESSVDWSQVRGAQPTDIDYQCGPALVGDDKFEPPAGVNFMSMEEMMKGMGN